MLGKGDYFGEQALLSGSIRTANVVAQEECECLVLDRASFHSLIGDLNELKWWRCCTVQFICKSWLFISINREKKYDDDSEFELYSPFVETSLDESSFVDINLNDLEVISTLGIGGKIQLLYN